MMGNSHVRYDDLAHKKEGQALFLWFYLYK